jgi:hypothetical protein
MHVVSHPHPFIIRSLNLGIPKFQLLAILHKISVAITLSLEHLAPLYTSHASLSSILSKAEVSGISSLSESNHLLAGEVSPILGETQSLVERREALEQLKGDIVNVLVNERIIKAKME